MRSRRLAALLLVGLGFISFGIYLHGEVPDVPTGRWLPGPALAQPREGAVSVALDDGRVLVIGGRTANGPVHTVDVFGTDGSITPGVRMLEPRVGHTAVKLSDGRVYVTGGTTIVRTQSDRGPATTEVATDSAEIFDLSVNAWYEAGSLAFARTGHTATVLADGHVLLAAGTGQNGEALDSFEVFDSVTDTLDSPGLLSAARTEHSAAAAGPRQAVVAGGRNADGVLGTADIVDVATGTVSSVILNAPRARATATALLDGRILVAGGSDGSNDLASTELLDPATGLSIPAASMAQPRRNHQALLLANSNTVLITGGTSAGAAVPGAEQFIPWTGELSSTGSPNTSRTSALLSNLSADGTAWLAAGRVADGSFPSAGELYGFATIKTDKSDYSPGMTVVVTGSGWQPGEAVSLLLHEVATGHADRTFSAIANDAGDIVNSEFVVDVQHIGVRFILTARGAASQAQTTFTDGNLQSNITFNIGPATVNVGDTLSWTATVACADQNQNNTCAGNGFILGGWVADTYSLDIQQSITANFTGPSVVSRQLSATAGGAAAGGFAVPTTAGTYFYRVRHGSQTIGSNTWQPQSSAVVTITVNAACTASAVTTQPAPQSINYGQNASFQAAATGTPTPTVQWQVSTDNGANWNNLAGATSATLALTQPTVAMSGNRYRAVFTNTCNGTQSATTNGAATLTVAKAAATVTLSNLTQTYTGSPLTPTATTNPADLNITWTAAPQTNAGTYQVTATVNDVNYQGSASGTFTINKAAATVALSDLTRTYTGSPLTPTAATTPESLNITWTGAPQTNAGSYPVTATVDDANYQGSATGTFTINKAVATVALSDLTQTYIGSPLTPTAATTPQGLNIIWTGAPQTNAGSYPVTATVDNANYQGSATGTFSINKAAATVALSDLTQTYTGSPLTPTAATTPEGLNITWTGAPQTNAGTYPVTATVDDANYQGSASGTFTINKAAATVGLSDLTQTYTGSPLTSTAATTPEGLNIIWTGAPQTNAGSYPVTATVDDPNYEGSASGTFTINKAASTTTTVGDGPFTYDGTTHAGGSGTVTGAGGLSTSATSLTYAGDRVNAGTYYVTAHYAGDANHEASHGEAVAIVINKAASTTTIVCPSGVTYTGLAQTPCTASVAGIGGLNQSVAVTYLNNTSPGTATANASYSGDPNHQASSDTKTFAITYGLCSPAVGAGGVILQPINSDGTSVFARKGGSTIPVKFRVCDASGNSISNPTAVFAGTGGALTMLSAVRGTVDIVNEPGISDIPDAAFRISGGQWIFNMSTANLTQGSTYTFAINLASGQSIQFRVGVK